MARRSNLESKRGLQYLKPTNVGIIYMEKLKRLQPSLCQVSSKIYLKHAREFNSAMKLTCIKEGAARAEQFNFF